MPVKLWSGLPGAGKTACMVAAILAFKKKHPDRPVFAININGLDPSVAELITLDQLHNWKELPPGSVICIDECQEEDYFPQDRGQPSAWVKAISKVRHEGMDFWLATQHPNLMSGYVRRLVDEHVHSVRKFKSSVVGRFTWGRCMENCEKESAQKTAIHSVGTLPKEVFSLYKSSNAHTMKRSIPWRAWVLPIAVVVAAAAIVFLPFALKRLQHAREAAITGGPASASSSATARTASAEHEDDAMRRTDMAKWMRPRLDGVPWSAPMFDNLQVRTVPKLYCVAVDDGRCTCHTEQGTRYAVPADRCRAIVADGLYNPFDGGVQDQQEDRQVARRRSDQPQAPSAAERVPIYTDSVSSGKERATAKAYTPPEYILWNADPFGGGGRK